MIPRRRSRVILGEQPDVDHFRVNHRLSGSALRLTRNYPQLLKLVEYARKRIELSTDNAANGFVGNHALNDPNPILVT